MVKSGDQALQREKQTGTELRRKKASLSAAGALRRIGTRRKSSAVIVERPEAPPSAETTMPCALSPDPEQEILDTIKQAFEDTLSSAERFSEKLQAMKADLFHRRYDKVFGCPQNLPVYAAQYIPPRALAYHRLLVDEHALLACISAGDSQVVSLGGGAGSELIGFLAASMYVRNASHGPVLRLTVVDCADWSDVQSRLLAAATSRWKLMCGIDVKTDFVLADTLELDGSAGAALRARLANATLVTAMFVLNELMAVSRGKTMRLLALLSSCLKRGAKLLVVDSAGSISNLQVNGNTYFLYMILDQIKTFRPIVADDSRWYRSPRRLSYPVECQNMRYFVRLYERV